MGLVSTFQSDFEDIYGFKLLQSLFPIVPYDFYVEHYDWIRDYTKLPEYEYRTMELKVYEDEGYLIMELSGDIP